MGQFTKFINSNSEVSESYKRKILTIFKTALKDVIKDSPDFTRIMGAVRLPKAKSPEVQAFSISEQRQIEQMVFSKGIFARLESF